MKRLIKIQQELVARKDKCAEKSADKFHYRTAERILAAVKDLLKETGTTILLTDDVQAIGSKVLLKATATLYGDNGIEIAHSNGWAEFDTHEVLDKFTGKVKKTMSAEQATGCASSYARKYALCGLFAIDDESQDPDSDEIGIKGGVEEKPQQTRKPKAQVNPTPQQKEAPKAPEKGQQEQNIVLTTSEQDEYDGLCADMDAAQSRADLVAIYTKNADKRYAAKLGEHAAAICARKGWQVK